MKPQMYRYSPRAARFSRLPLNSSRCAAADTSNAKNATRQLGGLLALAVVVLFPLLEPGKLFAQQTPVGDPEWSQNDQYNGQYAPNQQSEQQMDYGQQPAAQRLYPDSGQAYPQQGYGQAPAPAQPLNAVQLEQLVAPIALYPDALVAQVLAASTYPGQVADADHWRQTQGYASPDQIAAGADVQNWDPSVKALTAFPQVLAQMDRNLQWTTTLGNAYYNQPQDVLEAVQGMRGRARTAGTLQSTPEQAVHYDQGYIQLMPADPQVVYVPTYNPWTVYGEQVSPYPEFSLLGGGYSGNRGRGFGRAPDRYAENWRGSSNRGFHAFGGSYNRTPRQAYNHMQAPESRQQLDRRGYGSSLNRGTGEGYRGGPGAAHDRSMQAYRAPTSGFHRGEFGGRSSGAFASRDFAHSAGKPPHSGGFHLFGGGRSPKSVSSRGSGGFHMGGSGHAPKSFRGGAKSFGGGHSHGGGGHSGGHGGDKHHR